MPSDRPPAFDHKESPANRGFLQKVSDGIRTHDRLDHNQELYQLSYAHREGTESSNRWLLRRPAP